jgi:hypothetical protein
MCDCRTRIEEKLLNKFREVAPEATDHRAKLTGYALIFGETLTEKGCMAIDYAAKYPLKKGGTKEKATKISMMFTFCPFCGGKY